MGAVIPLGVPRKMRISCNTPYSLGPVMHVGTCLEGTYSGKGGNLVRYSENFGGCGALYLDGGAPSLQGF